MKELDDIVAEERKATAHMIISEGTSRDQVMPVSIAGMS